MKDSNIAWCHSTFNPWIGCTKVSPGCTYCYAAVSYTVKMKGIEWGPGKARYRTKSTWKDMTAWNKKPWVCPMCGLCMTEDESKGYRGCPSGMHLAQHHRRRVFCASLADVGDTEVPFEWFNDFMVLADKCRNLDILTLTKRPVEFLERWRKVAKHWGRTDDTLPPNIWMGVTCENQEMADKRIPELLKIPARVRFLSVEPLLGPVNLKFMARSFGFPRHITSEGNCVEMPQGIHWVIVGGESGSHARPCNVDWVRSVKDQCAQAGVPCFVKQLGAVVQDRNDAGFEGDKDDGWPMDTHTEEYEASIYQGAPVRVVLRDRKGGDMAEWPEDLRVRQFPAPR